MRPKDAQSGAGGAGAAGGRAARGAAAEAPLRASRRAWLATERRQTRMLRKVAAAPAAGRAVCGAAAEGRSTAVREQTRVM